MKYWKVAQAYLSSAIVYRKSGKAAQQLFIALKKDTPANSVNDLLRKRIRLYVAISFICAEWFSTLRGKKVSKKESEFITLIGAVTPIIDDLIDEQQLTSTEIIALLESPEKSNDTHFILAKYIYSKLQEIQNPSFQEVMKKALKIQDDSLIQLGSRQLSNQEIKSITYDKGGLATLLYRVVLDHPLENGEEKAQMVLGYVMQQINDAFDIYKDTESKFQTAFTTSNNLHENYDTFKKSIKSLVVSYAETNFNRKDIEKSLLKISVVLSQGEVCFRQLLNLQGDNEQFLIGQFKRKDLICDMEKTSNIWKTFLQSLKFYDQVRNALYK